MPTKFRQSKRPMAITVLTSPWLPIAAVIVTAAVIGASVLWFENQDRETDILRLSDLVVETVVVQKEVELVIEGDDETSSKQPEEPTDLIQTVAIERSIGGESPSVPLQRDLPQVLATTSPAPTSVPKATMPDDLKDTAMAEVVVQTVIVEKEVVIEREVQVAGETVRQVAPAHPAPASAQRSVTATPLAGSRPSDRRNRPSSPGATTFQDYPRSPYNVTAYDDTSTFSLDTDRTSFQLALNWARAGYEVDPVSVRAEEWVNAFNYGYEHPKHSGTFNIRTDIVSHPLYPGRHLARIAFQAPAVSTEQPLNVTLVLDASGSMADGNRVDIAREAAFSIRSSLGRDDRISVVHFTTNVVSELTVSNRHPDHDDVDYSIRELKPRGSTNVQAGLDQGVRLADDMRRQRPDALNYIVLMSDGVANVDATDPFAILESAHDQQAKNPLRIISVGVGISNYNDHLLEQLAQHGNGWYRYLSTTHEAQTLFSRDSWLALSVPFADQTRAQVTWDAKHVAEWHLIGYENRVTSDESFTEPLKKFAEIPAGAATTVFYELEFNSEYLEQRNKPSIGNVELRWVDPRSGASNSQHSSIVDDWGEDTQMLKFGAIVALASDLYSALDRAHGNEEYVIHDRLQELAGLLDDHESGFRETDGYKDFRFVLHHITEAVQPPPPPRATGYSR